MTPRDDLLNPIPGSNPSGENLRYDPVYDKIKEARREEDDAPQGDWQRARKTADYAQVVKLAGDALASKSKDVQLAVWYTEALLKREGFSGLRSGLDLIRALIENFWDTLYPELEDGDAELRAAPLDWLGGRMDATLRNAPLTRNGLGWFKYKEARTVGYEADADTDAKLEARAIAVADGKLSGEEWDQAFGATPKTYYAGLERELDGLLETVGTLDALCQAKFGDVTPSFGPLRTTLEEIRHTAHGLLQKKREGEPDDTPPAETAFESAESIEESATTWDEPTAATAPAKVKPGKGSLTAEPADKDDAFQRVVEVARYLRREDPYNPTPYLLLRGLRWGELRAAGSSIDGSLLESPPTEIRQALKKLALEGGWQQALELAENAAGIPAGRGWLDAQRYSFRAASELGYEHIAAAIRSEVNALLADYPDLPRAMLLDDTPAANAETQAWLKEIAPAPPAEAIDYAPPPSFESESGAEEIETIDANELALQAARAGRPEEAIEILSREAAAEKSGRGRFQRRLQLAQLCMSIGHERIAQPILEQLANEIDTRNLEGWEASSMVAHPLALLYSCLEKLNADPALKQKVYDRVCRLDPVQALSCLK